MMGLREPIPRSWFFSVYMFAHAFTAQSVFTTECATFSSARDLFSGWMRHLATASLCWSIQFLLSSLKCSCERLWVDTDIVAQQKNTKDVVFSCEGRTSCGCTKFLPHVWLVCWLWCADPREQIFLLLFLEKSTKSTVYQRSLFQCSCQNQPMLEKMKSSLNTLHQFTILRKNK